MVCKNCGYDNSNNSKRCKKCGNAFNDFTDFNDPSKSGIPSFLLRKNKDDPKIIQFLYYGIFIIFFGVLFYIGFKFLTT